MKNKGKVIAVTTAGLISLTTIIGVADYASQLGTSQSLIVTN